MSLNTVTLQGRLTKDPEIRATQGPDMALFTVAVDRDFKSKDGGKEADFINCLAFSKTAEFLQKYFTKGKPILLTGRIQVRQYLTKDGEKRTSTEVVAEKVFFCETSGPSGQPKKQQPSSQNIQEDDLEFAEYEDGDLPF